MVITTEILTGKFRFHQALLRTHLLRRALQMSGARKIKPAIRLVIRPAQMLTARFGESDS